MRARDLARFVTLTVLVCVLFSAVDVTAGTKIVDLDGQARSLDFSKSVPNQLNYQGFLVNAADSSTINATLEMTFRLFDSATDGTELWSETHPAVEVSHGQFYILLGSVTPFPADLFDGSILYLQMEVGTEVFTPRKPLVSVAYSQRTNSAEMLEDNSLTDLDGRWVNEEDQDHLDAADGDPVEAVYVDADGKVGVGTTSPLTQLDVNGSVNATTYYGDGSNLTGISGTTDNDWTISGHDIYHELGNVGIGTASPSARLDVSGEVNTDSVYQIGGQTVLSTRGDEVISVGPGAGANNTGYYSVFVGDSAGYNNQGFSNLFLGGKSGYSNTTGLGNTFVGESSGLNNTTGNINTFIGNFAGYGNAAGVGNTCLGMAAGYHSDAGNNNTFVGTHAGENTDTGSNNVFIGAEAGVNNSAGSYNVFIGYFAGYFEQSSNKLIIANGGDTSSVLLYGDFSSGKVGLGTMAPAERLHLHKASGHLGMRIQSDTASYQYLNFGADKGYAFGRDPDNKFFLNAEEPLGTGTLRILTATEIGNVGIGTTSPTHALQVNGDVQATTYYGDGSNLTGISGTTDNDWTISGNDIYSALPGNVGIGTTSPGRKLTVDGGDAIIKGDDGWDGSGDEALLYLGDSNHGIEAVYGEGVRIWTYDGPGADIRFRGHTGTDYMTVKMNTGNVGIGTTSPDYKLQVHSAEDLAGLFLTTQSSDDAIGCYCVASPGGPYHATGVAGQCIPADWYGFGVSGLGGYAGVNAACYEDGQVGKDYYGVKAVAGLLTSNGTSYGVYGWGSGGSASYGVYYAGGLGGSGTKSAIVRTEQGPKAVYCQESPENWFEDFGSGQIYGGRAEIQLADDFRQTVTVNESHPMKVFITPNAPIGEWWVETGTVDFTLMAPDAPDGARFDYRVVAKRQGYEELRLEAAPAAYVDHFLYPQVDEIPLEYREAWQRSLRAEEKTK